MVFVQDNLEEKYWKKLASLKDVENSVSDDSILSEYSALYEQNTDMIGWIKIDGTTIDYPVMQTKDSPEYYLRRNFNKEEEGGGTPFVDYRCDVLPKQSFNTIIYGHYTSGNTGFRWLLNYEAEKWYKEHKIIYFDTLQEKGKYEVIAAFYYDVTGATLSVKENAITDETYEFYNYIEIDSLKGYKKFIDNIEKRQLYETDAKFKMTDHLITLVCCAPKEYSDIEKNGRFIVIAKKI